MIKYFIIISIFYSQLICSSLQYFNGNKAFGYLVTQCNLGPRFPGSEGHTKAIELFSNHFKPLSEEFIIFEEQIIHPYDNDSLKLYNIFSRFNMESDNRILLIAHWDTRAIADLDVNEENKNKPIIGANDGASGVSVLMEIANLLHGNPMIHLGVDILLTDGEDIGKAGDINNFGLGMKEFTKHIPNPRPRAAICIDMVGDKELTLPIEGFSLKQNPDMTLDIWNYAESLGYTQFIKEIGVPIMDDHRVLYQYTNIPAINIIDFQYPNTHQNYWHTLEDTPDKCSASSLEAVGTVIINYLYQLDGMLNNYGE